MKKSFLFFWAISLSLFSISFGCNGNVFNNLSQIDSTAPWVPIPKTELDHFSNLPAVKFWQRVLNLNSDSVVVFSKGERQILRILPKSELKILQDSCGRDSYYHNVRIHHDLNYTCQLKYLQGRKEFYHFDKVMPAIPIAAKIFLQYEVSPVLAEMVLLIESPSNPHIKSVSGAAGHFQLMPYVAKKYGLVITENQDERVNLEKSAMAAAKHFKYYCIPQANKILEKHNILIDQNALWYQLFVLHVYHAGSGNVAKVVEEIGEVTDGNYLIQMMWQFTAGGFKSSSQNYSQIALAAYLNYEAFLFNINHSTNGSQNTR